MRYAILSGADVVDTYDALDEAVFALSIYEEADMDAGVRNDYQVCFETPDGWEAVDPDLLEI